MHKSYKKEWTIKRDHNSQASPRDRVRQFQGDIARIDIQQV